MTDRCSCLVWSQMATMEGPSESLHEYPFELTEVPRLSFDDPQAERLISNQVGL